jgi:hypothetical protein
MIGLPVVALSVMVDQVKSGKGFIIKTNGDVAPFNPTVEDNGNMVYDLNAVRSACNFDYVEIARLRDDIILLCDEEGLCKANPVVNIIATKLFQNAIGSERVGIIGDCVICHTKAVN